jgi:D-amino-acid dehydrogenase
MGRTKVSKLWVNAGHGTLGWTHGAGSGKALAELISGEQPAMAFDFYGVPPRTQAPAGRSARLSPTPPPSQA